MWNIRQREWRRASGTPDSVAHSAHSLPELSMERQGYGKSNTGRPASVDLLLDPPMQEQGEMKIHSKQTIFDSGEFIPIDIMKGNGGFGFTIADSISGQKVHLHQKRQNPRKYNDWLRNCLYMDPTGDPKLWLGSTLNSTIQFCFLFFIAGEESTGSDPLRRPGRG